VASLTERQLELYEYLVHRVASFLDGADVRVARVLERHGLVTITDNGFMPRSPHSRRSDRERWYVRVVPVPIPFNPRTLPGVTKLAPEILRAHPR
jgi:hypothetical protein